MKLILLLLLAPTICFSQTVLTPPVTITPTYPGGVTAAQNVLIFPNPNGHQFAFNLSQTLQGNNPNDDVMMWGWNVDANTPNEPTLRFSMERAFGSNYEVHLESITPGGAMRPWTWTINRSTGEATVITSATSRFYGGGWQVNGKPELHVTPTETLSMGSFRQVGDSVKFETTANGGAHHKQIRIISHPNDSGLSRLVFGATENGVSLSNPTNAELEVTRAGVYAPINAGQYKVSGTKVVGTQCAAILNSDGTLADTVRAVNATLACLRSHGLAAN